jgi:hypothetical protein
MQVLRYRPIGVPDEDKKPYRQALRPVSLGCFPSSDIKGRRYVETLCAGLIQDPNWDSFPVLGAVGL